MSIRNLLTLLVICAGLTPAQASAQHTASGVIALRGTVHLGSGQAALADHGVLIKDGKIVRVAPWSELEIPDGAAMVEAPGAEITPGLIDACSTAGVTTPKSWAEHGSEVVPHLRVLDAIDLASSDFDGLVRRGITSVYVTAGPGSVIGSQGTVLKTAGPRSRRMLRKAGAIRASFGLESIGRGVRNHRPSTRGALDFATRRPTTRMGAVWIFRDAFSRANRDALEGPAAPILREVLAGKRPLRVQARKRDVIEAAIRLTREFGIPLILEEATEAYHLVPMLKANGVDVIFGPLAERPRGPRAGTGESNNPCLRTPVLLAEAGVRFCLTANDRREEDGLWAQGMLATRYGLSVAKTVEALTSTPAKILGGNVATRIGELTAGRDADVVVWSGSPFEATTRPVLVLVNGEAAVGALPQVKAPAKTGSQKFK